MDAFIYFTGNDSADLDELEDAIEERLDGGGEVTGTGTGEAGSNIDVEFFDELTPKEALGVIRHALQAFTLPENAYVVIGGDKYLLH